MEPDDLAQPQSYSLPFGWLREDEYHFNFNNDSKHAVTSWQYMSDNIRNRLSEHDYKTASEVCNFESLDTYVRMQIVPQFQNQAWMIQPLPSALLSFVAGFERNVLPLRVDMSLLWSMVYYNIKLASESFEKLRRTSVWLSRLRRSLILCNSTMDLCNNTNELRISLPEMLNPLLELLVVAINRLVRSPTDNEYSKVSPEIERKVKDCLESLDEILKHLREINSYSQVNLENQVRFIRLRTEARPEERVPLQIFSLPEERNKHFFGREDELAAINEKLGAREISALQSYTIYGRRGVGKTHLALEYCHRNMGNFDAIFWIRCETSASLRQSIASIAKDVNVPGASPIGHHEENLVGVHDWLKTTSARWLLVFDNAEKERLLKGYWPVGARGSILITSRTHYNFMMDMDRGGMTVQLFDNEQSLQLLLKLLGKEWQDTHLVEPFTESDLAAARALMNMIGGLALAIQQAANLIVSLPTSLRGFLDIFVEKSKKLPPRPLGERDQMVRSLDSIWSIAFDALSDNARAFLGVLAFLAPDEIQMDLFLPANQKSLEGRLEFCMSNPNGEEGSHAALSNAIDTPPNLQAVIDELENAKLITVDNRMLKIHRVIQEALNYQNFEDLQDSFNATVRLVYEAFPKKENVGSLQDRWTTCEEYVQHVVQLFTRFKEYGPSNVESANPLEPSKELILLGASCGWYLLEVADYVECLDMVKIAQSVSESQGTLTVARLHNIAASAYFDLNKLDLCREGFETNRDIRENQSGSNDGSMASALANLGNLETAEEHFDDARALFHRAVDIRQSIGESATTLMGLHCLQIGRVDDREGKFPAALKMFQKAETLFNRAGSRNYLADLHYAYGNREYLQSNYKEAMRSYNTCLRYVESTRPYHPLTGAVYYKLGSCAFELDDYDKARRMLFKSLNIAEIQNPGADDGTVARILWKLAEVFKWRGVFLEEAQEMTSRAIAIRRDLTGRSVADETWVTDHEFEILEHSYTVLVPSFFR